MKKWGLVFVSSYVVTTAMVLVDPDLAFTGRNLRMAPIFEFVVWISAIVNGLATGFLLWRALAKRDAILAGVTALPVACVVGFAQYIALQAWAVFAIWYT